MQTRIKKIMIRVDMERTKASWGLQLPTKDRTSTSVMVLECWFGLSRVLTDGCLE